MYVSEVAERRFGYIKQDKTIAVQDPKLAKTIAQSRFRRSVDGAVEATVNMVGTCGVMATSIINIWNIGIRMSGRWYVKKATHNFTATSGYTLTLDCICDGHKEFGVPSNAKQNKKKTLANDAKREHSRLMAVAGSSGWTAPIMDANQKSIAEKVIDVADELAETSGKSSTDTSKLQSKLRDLYKSAKNLAKQEQRSTYASPTRPGGNLNKPRRDGGRR
jgi:hypothetical protein